MRMHKFFLFTILIFVSHEGNAQILDFQKNLVSSGTTGSNVFVLFKDGNTVYKETVNSGALGDADIGDSTIFAIHSMTKTITTVAMMILHDKGLYELNDDLHKYLPEFENVNCKGEEGIYPCKKKIKIIDLLTHRSGYKYYA